jgi:hypothetical protein
MAVNLSASLCRGALHARSKGFESDASIRQFLALGREGSKADEGGPSQLDIRDLRSLSLSFPSFSIVGPPIGVSLPDCDLRELRNFISNGATAKVPPFSSVVLAMAKACLLTIFYGIHALPIGFSMPACICSY